MSQTFLIVVGLIVFMVVSLVYLYNKLVRLKNRVEEAESDIEVQLKRRYDLIGNLVEAVKGYAQHEKTTLTEVIEARNRAMQAQSSGDTQKQQEAENVLASTLKSIFALAENYPDLKANQNFLELQRELSDTENKIQAARRFYNSNVRDYNMALELFPTNILAQLMHYQKKEYFEIEEAKERERVEVKF